jgi:hypothetical protein
MYRFVAIALSFLMYSNSLYAQSYSDAQAHAIVSQGTVKDVYKLIKSGYNLDNVYQCKTLLITAIESAAENLVTNEQPENALKKIKLLLDNGANYNQNACEGKSLPPIFWAISLPLLLQETENELNTVLDESMKNKGEYCDIAKIVSKECTQITPEEREKIRTYFRENTISSIKKLNPYFVKIVKLLIKKGANINKTDERGQTVLHYAAAMPKEITTESLKLLLDKGIFVDTQNPEKHTPLFFAYGTQNKTAINLLLDAGADPTMRDIEGYLPHHSKSVSIERTSHEDGSISIHLKN